jgi:hypothetical protein
MRMLLSALAVAMLSAGPLGSQEQDKKIPKDSVEVVVTGCLKGRFLTTTRTPRLVDGDDLEAPVDRFQISGKKPVLDDVKKHDRGEVEIVGFIRKRDLKEPGIRVPGGRVVLSPGRGGDRYPPPPTSAPQRVVLLEASTVRALDGPCDLH